MSKQKSKVNVSLNSIEASIVGIYQKAEIERKELFDEPEVKEAVLDFIFGKSEDNPFKEITKQLNSEIDRLRKKINKESKTEKDFYIGKRKRSEKSIKKVLKDVLEES